MTKADRAAVMPYGLTTTQASHLVRLLEASALNRENAVTVFKDGFPGFLEPVVVGKLIGAGFAEAAVRSRAGQRLTVYWLTMAGHALALNLCREGIAA